MKETDHLEGLGVKCRIILEHLKIFFKEYILSKMDTDLCSY